MEDDQVKEVHDVWTPVVCTSTELGDDNWSMIVDSCAEEHVITRGDWQRLGRPQLQLGPVCDG